MIEFIAGLVLGAIFGVVADRVWEKFEKKARLHMTISSFRNIRQEEGLKYKVRNVGASEIPDFQILLWHPNRGSMMAFNTTVCGPLLPDQTREFSCTLYKSGSPVSFLAQWISHEGDHLVQNPCFNNFKLLVKMLNSETVFLESEKMGNAVAKEWYRSLIQKQPGRSTWEENKAMNSPAPLGLKYWLERRRQKKELKAIIAKHKAFDISPTDRSGGSTAT